MDWRDHIAADPNILVGKPTTKGTASALSW